MDRHLHVRYRVNVGTDESEREILLSGDRRQTPEQMIHEGFREHFGEQTECVEKGEQYTSGDGKSLTVVDHKLVSGEEADRLRSELFTRQVNRNVTEEFVTVRYSGRREYG